MRLRLAIVVAAAVALGAYSLLHHGQRWTTYNDAKHGWTIDVPRSFDVRPGPLGAGFASVRDEGTAALPDSAMALGLTSPPRSTVARDTTLPLDPVALHAPSALGATDLGVLTMTFFHHHRVYELSVTMHGTQWQSTAFRMIRSVRFSG